MATKKTNSKLILASPPAFCPECKQQLTLVSADGTRVVVRHDEGNFKARECVKKGAIWTYAAPSVSASEV